MAPQRTSLLLILLLILSLQATAAGDLATDSDSDIDVASHPPGATLPPAEFADGDINETGNRGVDATEISYTDDLVIALSDQNITNALRGHEDKTAKFYDYLNWSSYSLTVAHPGGTSHYPARIELNESTTTVACTQQCDVVYLRVPLYDIDYHRVLPSGEDGRKVSLSDTGYSYHVELRIDRNGTQSVVANDDFDLDPPSANVVVSRTNGKHLTLGLATHVEANVTARLEPVSHEGEAIPIELERDPGGNGLLYNSTVPELRRGARYELRLRANGYRVRLLDGPSEERFYVTAGSPTAEMDVVRTTETSVVVDASLSAGGFLAVEAEDGSLDVISDRLEPGAHEVRLTGTGRTLGDKSVVAFVDTDGDGHLNRTRDSRYDSTLQLETLTATRTATMEPSQNTTGESSTSPSSEPGAGFGILAVLGAVTLVVISRM
jgi:hypothetical protein